MLLTLFRQTVDKETAISLFGEVKDTHLFYPAHSLLAFMNLEKKKKKIYSIFLHFHPFSHTDINELSDGERVFPQ